MITQDKDGFVFSGKGQPSIGNWDSGERHILHIPRCAFDSIVEFANIGMCDQEKTRAHKKDLEKAKQVIIELLWAARSGDQEKFLASVESAHWFVILQDADL